MTNRPQNISPKQAMIVGAFWSVGARWAIRLIGFVSTMIMARLLAPSDYGLVAMAMLVLGVLQASLDFGAATALLRKRTLTKDEIDSAWTLGVIEGMIIGGLVLISIPLATAYFQEPRISSVLAVLAIVVCIAYSGNIGLVLAQREFNFALAFRHAIYVKLISVGTTLIVGWLLRDYRALLSGIAAGYLAGMALSYLMHPYRPRWNTSEIANFWAVTKWLMLAGAGGFILRKSDEILASRLGTTREFGLYNVGSDLGQMPTAEIGPAILRTFLPVLSSLPDDQVRINAAVIKTTSALNTIILPMGFGLATIALPATQLLLGDNWTDAAPFVALFSILGCLQLLASPLNSLLTLTGHTRYISRIVWLEFLCFGLVAGSTIVLSAGAYDLRSLVLARLSSVLVNFFLTGWVTRQHCSLGLSALVGSVGRPLFGALVMCAAVLLAISGTTNPFESVSIAVLVGASTFTAWTLSTWYLVGCPEGLESTIVDYLRVKLSRRA